MPARMLASVVQHMREPDPDRAVRVALGDSLGGNEVRTLEEAIMAERFWDRIHLLRAAGTRSALPRIKVLGLENLDQAVERGRGVVLWIGAFTHSSTVVKRALHEAGYPVAHLSRPTHTSPSRYGVKFLNRWRMSIEDRFIAERIMLTPAGMVGAMRQLMKRLRNNGIISITAGDEAGHSGLAPFLNAQIRLAPGAIRLATGAGAALIPVVAQRIGNSEFEVILGEPLPADADLAVQRYIADLEPYVLASPQQWHGWRTVRPITASSQRLEA